MFAFVEIEGKGKTDSTLKVKKGPSQREAGISHVLVLFSTEVKQFLRHAFFRQRLHNREAI